MADDEVDFSATSKLKEALSVSKLLSQGEHEFTLDDEHEDFWNTDESDCKVESAFNFSECEKHINLEAIDPSDMTTGGMPFDKLERDMENVTPDGKVKKMIMRSGTIKIPEGALVYLHYNSYLEMAEMPFDSSYLRQSDPVKIKFDRESYYPGFSIAIMSMSVGEQAKFLIHPDLAFRDMGAPPRIPPNATVLLVAEVFKTVDCGLLEEKIGSGPDNRKFELIYPKAMSYHALGNDFFSQNNLSGAVANYKKAENLLISCWLKSQEEEVKMKHLLFKIYLNMAVCFNNPKLQKPEKVCIAVRRAIEMDKEKAFRSSKLFYQRGKAYTSLCEYKLALKDYKRAQKLEPNNECVNKALLSLENKMKLHNEYEKNMCTKAFGISTNGVVEDSASWEVDESCKGEVTEILEDFAKGNLASLNLSSGYTYGERAWLQKESERLGLDYSESHRGTKREICIKKK